MSSSASGESQRGLRIDLYRTDDYVRFGRVGLPPILRAMFEPALEQSLDDAVFTLLFLAVADPAEVDGEPSVVNLRGSHGFVNVQISRDGKVLYQHPHSVREIFGRPLQKILATQYPDEKHFGYGITGPGLEHVALVRPAPRAVGSIDLRGGSGRPRLFRIEEVPEPDPPAASLADFGVVTSTDSGDGPGERVVLSREVHDGLLRTMTFSREVEEGGFLIGQVYSDRERPGHCLVVVTEALSAERTGASLLQFTFTGESFLRINDLIARRQGDGSGPAHKLVGWYHTHLFAATEKLGLSTIDIDLHTRTFKRKWHIAGLVNIDGDSRTLRVYGWDGTQMHQLPFWPGEPAAATGAG